MDKHYTLIKSKRKSISVEILGNGEILVRAPKYMTLNEIDVFVTGKEAWINKHLQRLRDRQNKCSEPVEKLSKQELEALKKEAKPIFEICVREYAELLNVSYGHISIRAQKTLWGSCTRQGNLNFNCLLLMAPPMVLRYVVVHELCHRREMNHSAAFWKNVAGLMPEYKEYRKWLKENGSRLIERLPER